MSENCERGFIRRGGGFSGTGATESATVEEVPSHDLGLEVIFGVLDFPAFALDKTGTVVAWNDRIADLLDAPESEVLGSASLGADLYDSDQRDLTLAEKIAERPEATHEAFPDVGIADEEYALLSGEYVYEDTSVVDGTEIWFVATPVFRDGEFLGVVEIVQDISSSARYQRELEARVQFDDSETFLEDQFTDIVEDVNEMGAAIDTLVTEVEDAVERFDDIVAAIREATEGIQQVSEATDDQASSAEEISAMIDEAVEMADDISASVETIVSHTDRQASMVDELDDSVGKLSGGDRIDGRHPQ